MIIIRIETYEKKLIINKITIKLYIIAEMIKRAESPIPFYDPEKNQSTQLHYDKITDKLEIKFQESQIVKNIIKRNEERVLNFEKVESKTHKKQKDTKTRQRCHTMIPRTSVSEIITQICQDKGDKKLQQIYQINKSKNTKTSFSYFLKNDKTFVHPKNITNKNNLSKAKKSYFKSYETALGELGKQIGEFKPLESKYCVTNYIFSQLSASGLASRKFNSIKSGRRISFIKTESSDFPQYPKSPRLLTQLKQLEQKKSKKMKMLNKIKKDYDKKCEDYKQIFLLDDKSSIQLYLKNIKQLEDKKAKIYQTSAEGIQKLKNLVIEQGFQHFEMFDEIIKNSKKKSLKQSLRKKHNSKVIAPNSSSFQFHKAPKGRILLKNNQN